MKAAKIVQWAILNGFISFALVRGTVFDEIGWRSVALFYMWSYGVLVFGLMLPTSKQIVERLREKGRSIPGWLSRLVDMGMISIMAYHGWFVTSALWVIQMSVEYKIFDSHEEGKQDLHQPK